MNFEHIVENYQLVRYCRRIEDCEYLAFDTEFVSENRYRPQLCLVQVATPLGLAIIDTLSVGDMTPFWNLVCRQIPQCIVHAAREEFLFCRREAKARPRNLIDLQLLAAFAGFDYPAAYSSLVSQILGERLVKGETRTDWRQRPLSKKQIHYALQDVAHLYPMYQVLQSQVAKLGREAWYKEEIDEWQRRLEIADSEAQWHKLPGISKLNPRELAIVRELFFWREEEAERRERTPRKILPDDLIVELAKRGEHQPARLTAIRGLTQRVSSRHIPELGEVVAKALALPESELPAKLEQLPNPNIGILGQFLTTSLTLICHERRIAPSLVATAQDLRQLAAWKMGLINRQDEKPFLMRGWRREFLADLIEDVIKGRLALRVHNPKSAAPVQLVRWPSE